MPQEKSIIVDAYGKPYEERSNVKDPAEWFLNAAGGQRTSSGERVTQSAAWALSAYFACISNISEDIAKLPLHVYKRKGRAKTKATNNDLYRLLHAAPNPEMTSFSFRETMAQYALAYGDAYAEIQRSKGGKIIAIWPLDSSRMKKVRDEGGRLIYVYHRANNEMQGFDPVDILHVHGLGDSGTSGVALVDVAREVIGSALAVNKFASTFFGNGAWMGGMISVPHELSPKARNNLVHSFEERHQGAGKSHRLGILEDGVEWKGSIGVEPDKAQLIEVQKFKVEDIARLFRMPPHKIQMMDAATYSNIEQQSIEYVTDTLMPWLSRFEQEFARSLFISANKNLFAEFLVTGLLRGDSVSRAAYYRERFMIGTMSQNEIRELENENPIGPEGDTYFVLTNLLPPGQTPAPGNGSRARPIGGESGDFRVNIVRRLAAGQRPSFGSILLRLSNNMILKCNTARKRSRFDEWASELASTAMQSALIHLSPFVDAFVLSAWRLDSDQPLTDCPRELVRTMSGTMAERFGVWIEGYVSRGTKPTSDELWSMVGDEMDELQQFTEGLLDDRRDDIQED